MIRLSGDTEKLQAFLAGAVATTQPDVMVSFKDAPVGNDGQFGDYVKVRTLSGASVVDICDPPVRAAVREIESLSIRNNDTASVTLTVQLLSGATARQIIAVTLLTGEHLFYSHVHGWQALAADGQLKVIFPSLTVGDLLVTGNLTVNGNTALGNATTDTTTILGNVGIGQASESRLLHIFANPNNGTIQEYLLLDTNTQNISVSGSGATIGWRGSGDAYAGAVGSYGNGAAGGIGIWGGRAASGLPDVYVLSGNVGIGISPVPHGGGYRVLHIDSGATNAELRLTNAATGSAFGNGVLLSLVGVDAYLFNLENSFLAFGTNGVEGMRLDAAGNVGIGLTPNSTPRLDVAKSATAGDVTTARQLRIGVDASSTYSLYAGYYFTGSVFAGVLQALDNGTGTLLLLNPSGGDVGLGVGRLYGLGLHNHASGISGTTNQYIGSVTAAGAVPANFTNCTTGSTTYFIYNRTGNVVSGELRCTAIDVTAAGFVQFTVALPIASNLTAATDLLGVGVAWEGGAANIVPVKVIGSVADLFVVEFIAPNGNTYDINIHFAYEVK